MKTTKWLSLGAPAIIAAAITVSAIGLIPNKTFRTAGSFLGIVQGQDPLTDAPRYDYTGFAGWNLVNLAMGRAINDTNDYDQVMAMTFACDLSAAQLVVYDKATSNIVATIAASTGIDTVKSQSATGAGPNRARFVAQFQLDPSGNETHGLAGGYFTLAGRVHLNPATGCPKPVLVALDNDRKDKDCGDKEISGKADKDERLVERAGLGHLIGVFDMVTDGQTNRVLVPRGNLSIRRELAISELN